MRSSVISLFLSPSSKRTQAPSFDRFLEVLVLLVAGSAFARRRAAKAAFASASNCRLLPARHAKSKLRAGPCN